MFAVHLVVTPQKRGYKRACGKPLIACRTPRSAIISSDPPRMAANLLLRWNCSTTRPIPVCVMALPPKIWHDWSITVLALRVQNSFLGFGV